jgi:hypothetical protein
MNERRCATCSNRLVRNRPSSLRATEHRKHNKRTNEHIMIKARVFITAAATAAAMLFNRCSALSRLRNVSLDVHVRASNNKGPYDQRAPAPRLQFSNLENIHSQQSENN